MGRPVHVWNPRLRALGALSIFVPLALVGIWGSISYGPLYSAPNCTGKGCTPPGLFAFLGLSLTATAIWDIIRARKLEFYEEFVRVIGKGGAPDQDFRYDQLTVGPLTQYRSSNYFVISANALGKPLIFHINDERIKGTDERLYDWLENCEAEREKLTPEILKAQSMKSKFKFVWPIGVLAGIALVIIGPWIFWSIETPLGTPIVDVDIGFGFIFAGFALIATVLIVRGVLNARYTSH